MKVHMWLDRVSNPGPLAHESDVLPTALSGPAIHLRNTSKWNIVMKLYIYQIGVCNKDIPLFVSLFEEGSGL